MSKLQIKQWVAAPADENIGATPIDSDYRNMIDFEEEAGIQDILQKAKNDKSLTYEDYLTIKKQLTNTNLILAYLNPLTREFVEVVY